MSGVSSVAATLRPPPHLLRLTERSPYALSTASRDAQTGCGMLGRRRFRRCRAVEEAVVEVQMCCAMGERGAGRRKALAGP
uniref:Uncharacterized protein n=1 Tax=Arundo donax TaxID=35708 RepID=A0A0A9GG56_ARUDO